MSLDSSSRSTRTAAAVGVLLASVAVVVAPSAGCSGDDGASIVKTTGAKGGAGGEEAGAGGRAGKATGGNATGGNASGGKASGGMTGGSGAPPVGDGGEGGEAGSEAAGNGGQGGEPPLDPPPPVCGDKFCDEEHGEECDTCPGDCGACADCGNGMCEKGLNGQESCFACPEDCGSCSVCGDAKCSVESGEDCTTCPQDCNACVTCGNGTCDGEETCASCAKDCGVCKTCGNGVCDGGETCGTCAEDCDACPKCGDHDCNGAETTASCPGDCPAPTPTIRKGCIQGDFKPYWGGLHAHTHVSDGAGTPNEAFEHASHQQMDFLWLSDHYQSITPAEYAACLVSANKHNKAGTFVTGCGYEAGIFKGAVHKSAWVGHFNVLFPTKLHRLSHNSPGIFEDMLKCEGCLGQFNHPPKPADFDGYDYHAVAKDKVRLMEFSGGPWEPKLDHFFKALDKGWTISPSWNEDNHHKKWGDDPQGTLVWAKELSRTAIRAGVAARRTAAVGDKGISLKVIADGKCWMGSELTGLGKTTLTVTLKDKQPTDGFTLVTLYGKHGKKLNEKGCGDKSPCTLEFTETLTENGYLVVVARQKDGGWAVSAPIWYDKLSVTTSPSPRAASSRRRRGLAASRPRRARRRP